MQSAYSVKSGETESTTFGRGRSVSIVRATVTISGNMDLLLITAGMPTDPRRFVEAVDSYYAHLRANRLRSSSIRNGGQKHTYNSPEAARAAYEMLVRIGNM